jgi:hypothetical protein
MRTRSFVRSSAVHAALAAATLVAVAPAAGAQYSVARYPSPSSARQLFVWEGRVDREIELVLRDDRLFVRPLGPRESASGSSRLFSTLPRRDGYLRLERVDGRGSVEVLEQPTASNGYRAVVRVTDPRSGAGSYRVAAYWEPAWGGSGRGRDRDGRYDPRDDRDDDRSGGYRRRAGGTMRWSGAVDALTQIQLRGGRVTTTTLRGQPTRAVFTRVDGTPLYGDDARLSVSVREGRGTVTVVEQPSASNGYTAVVRVHDPAGGFGHYDFDLTWR